MRKPKTNYRDKLSEHELDYCERVAKGDDCKTAYLEAFKPDRSALNDWALSARIRRLNRKPLVSQRISEITERFKQRIESRYDGLKERLIDRMVDAIDASTEDDPRGMIACVPMVKQICDMLGFSAPKDITVRNGGVSADYRPPPAIMDMSDEELESFITGDADET